MIQNREIPSKKEFYSAYLDLFPGNDFPQRIKEFLADDRLDIIIMVTTDMIIDEFLHPKNEEGVPEGFLLLPGERALFEEEEIKLLESQAVTDYTCLDGFFAEGSRTVYLVGDNEKKMRSLMKCFQKINPELTVQGAYYVNPTLSQELKLSDELIVNEINGNDPDVLVVMMDSPRQEEWIKENQSILHAKICLGMGAVTDSYIRLHRDPPGFFRSLHLGGLYNSLFNKKNKGEKGKRRIFYKKLEQYKNKKEQ